MRLQFAFRRLIACCLVFTACIANATGEALQLGVFPYLPPGKLQELFEPIAADLENALNRKITLSTRTEYESFTSALKAQEFDIALIHPFDYPAAHDRLGYLPIARRKEELRALILVNAESPIRTLADLRGKTVANPPREAAVSYLTSMALLGAGIDPVKGVKRDFGKGHFSCMQKVLIGEADACGTAYQAMMHFEKEKQLAAKFRVMHESEPISHALFVVHKRIPGKERDVLQARILDWPNTVAGRKIIDAGRFIPFVAAADKDYVLVRKIMKKIGQ